MPNEFSNQRILPADPGTAETTFASFDSGRLYALPVYTYDQIADYLTDDFWNLPGNGAPHAFDLAANGGVLTYDVTALTPEGQALARAAMEAWAEVSGLTFVEVTTGYGTADINFDDDDPDGAYAYSIYDGSGNIDRSYVNIPTWWLDDGSNLDSYGYQTYLHEIGHALGLGHAGPYNGSASYPTDAAYANDSWQATVMSYFTPTENTYITADFGFAITPMIADIIAIQNLYGTSTTTRTGDTTYGDGNTTGNAIYGLTGTAMLTLFDSDGTDTIDLASRTDAQRLDLNPESISDINGRIGNLSIARGTVIENAITGSGNDTIIGNDADNVLSSGGGVDSLTGGAGSDTLIGGAGGDVLSGGSETDFASYQTAAGGVTVDLLSPGLNTGDAAGDSYNSIEGVIGSDQIDTLRGDNNANVLIGGRGHDVLVGRGGDDSLVGGDGNDVMMGNSGADTMDGGDGRDWALYAQSPGGVLIDMLYPELNTGEAAGDTYVSVEAVAGSPQNDTIRGDNDQDFLLGKDGADVLAGRGGDDHLYGENGPDILIGGEGADYLNGGGGRDYALYGQSPIGLVIDMTDPSASTGEAYGDVFEKVEGIAGTDYNDSIVGNDVQNFLFGRDGNDTLIGNGGDDHLYGDNGGDRLEGGIGNDVLGGGGGPDTFVFTSGQDLILDFQDDADTIELDSDLWGGTPLSAAEVLAYASVVDGDVVFDFGNGNTLTIENFTNISALEDDLLII